MTLPPLPPLPPLPGAPQLPLPFPVSGTNSFPASPALPPLPPRRIYSQGRRVTDWYPMRVQPCADRKGEYEVRFDNEPESLEYWDGKRWPTLAGNFHVTGWRGVADDPATPA